METTTAGDISPLDSVQVDMDHAPGTNRWTRTNSESCLPRPESKTVRFNAEEVGHFILVTENTTQNPPKGSEFWKGNPGWEPEPENFIKIHLARIIEACQGFLHGTHQQDQDPYHSERAFRGFSLGPTIGVTLGSWDKAHLSNKISKAWFYPIQPG